MKRKGMWIVLAMLAILSLQVRPGIAQDTKEMDAIKEDLRTLKEGQKQLQKDIQEIKTLVKSRPAAGEFKEAVINIQGAPAKGAKDAKLALIEFSDYQ